jgi:3-methyladenine DNA glycosylase AlkD
MYQQILEKLYSLEEEKYREFSSRLLPNITTVRGIRLPLLQKMAKDISKGDVFEYFAEVKHTFFEETLLMGLVIGNMNLKRYSLEQILSVIRSYIPYINNWSTCDSFCSSLKVAKSEPDRMYEFISVYAAREGEGKESLSSPEREYELRFYIVMCLDYYINDSYIDEVLYQFRDIKSSSYYVNMALAWAYSKIYLYFPERVISWLKEGLEIQSCHMLTNHDLFLHNKTISKICDSYKVEKQDKELLRQYIL